MAKVLVSIDDDLLSRIDERARELGLTRSAYVSQLARTHLQDGVAVRIDPRRVRSIARARAACASATVTADSTDLIRQMRDER